MAYSLDVKSVGSAHASSVLSKEPQEISAFKLVQDGVGDQSITTAFIDAMREFLNDPATKETYRAVPSFFTRDRCFTFAPTCVALLFEHASPAQTRMLHMFQDEASVPAPLVPPPAFSSKLEQKSRRIFSTIGPTGPFNFSMRHFRAPRS